jgi:hypothetical protein
MKSSTSMGSPLHDRNLKLRRHEILLQWPGFSG